MAVPRDYHGADAAEPDRSVMLDQLVDRLEDYRAVVHRCSPADLATTVAAALVARAAGRQSARLVVPPGLDRGWLSGMPADGAVTVVTDTIEAPLDAAALDQLDGVVTACTVAVAQTGTIVLDAAPDQGRRIITLIPDYHLVVVRAEQVVATVPHAVARLDPTRPLTMISGPSATSDIELNRVEGVHGPRTLEVVVVD
jgi:L-lactate dehydrogenase complex protein LldG